MTTVLEEKTSPPSTPERNDVDLSPCSGLNLRSRSPRPSLLTRIVPNRREKWRHKLTKVGRKNARCQASPCSGVCMQCVYSIHRTKTIRKKRSVAVIRPRSLKHLVDVTGMRALRKGFISSKLYSLASSFLSRQIIFLRTFYFAAYLFSVSPNYLVGRVTGIFRSRPVLSFIRIYFGGDVFAVVFL